MPIPDEPIDLRSGPARNEVGSLLERLIVAGELAPGTRLVDAELLTLTGSSRAPLREALNALEVVHLVEVAPRLSTRVAPVDAARDRDCLEIEGAMMRQVLVEAAPLVTAADRAAVRAAARPLFASARAYRTGVRDREHRRLLDVFVDKVGNPEYRRVLAHVTPLVDRHATLNVDAVDAPLRALFRVAIDAALDGDGPAAGAAWDEFSNALRHDVAYAGEVTTTPRKVNSTLRDKAAAVIEAEILMGGLVPGEALRESDLMRWLGVSRTPVREALTLLGHKGLVDLNHQRTVRVAELSAEVARDVLRALAVLRALQVRSVIARNPRELSQAVTMASLEWEAAEDSESILDAAFELVAPLNELGANSILKGLAGDLAARMAWTARRLPEAVVISTRDALREVRTALIDSDADAAEQAVRRLYVGE